MKQLVNASKFLLSCALCVGMFPGAATADNEGRIKSRLEAVPLPEMVAEAIEIIDEASKKDRPAVMAKVIEGVLQTKPQAGPTIVFEVAKLDKTLAADAALLAATTSPENLSLIASAAIAAAPDKTRQIVAKLAQSFPKKRQEILSASNFAQGGHDRVGMAILGLRDADPNVFGVQNREALAALTPESAADLSAGIERILGLKIRLAGQDVTTNIVVIGVSLNVVNSIVSAIAASGAITTANFSTIVQSVVNQAAAADSSTSARNVLKNTLTSLGVDDTTADSVADDAAADGGPVQVAVENSQNIVELVTVSVAINPTTKRSYSGTIGRN